MTGPPQADPGRQARRTLLIAAAWIVAMIANEWLSRWWHPDSGRVEEALHFFITDSIRLLLLLTAMVWIVAIGRTAVTAERIRGALTGRGLIAALTLAAAFGAVTPFCSCSSIPVFIALLAAGVPVAVALTFLIASPLINEVAVVLLAQSFGWQISLLYVGLGFALAIGAGALLSRLSLDRYVIIAISKTPPIVGKLRASFTRRLEFAAAETRQIVGRIWWWLLIGVAAGAAVHGWIPEEFFADVAGRDDPLAVPIATVAGIPMYSNAVGVIPLAESLWAKGMGIGTVMALMMSTVALSLPELILLRRAVATRLIAIFVGIVATGIVTIGIVLNVAG